MSIIDIFKFGLVPVLMGLFLVYRGWYSKRENPTAMTIIWFLVFTIVYIWRVGWKAGLLGALIVVIIWFGLGNAIRKLWEKEGRL